MERNLFHPQHHEAVARTMLEINGSDIKDETVRALSRLFAIDNRDFDPGVFIRACYHGVSPSLTYRCAYCPDEVSYVLGRGWIHRAGGGAYQVKCAVCGWLGTPAEIPETCPECHAPGHKNMRDNHIACPNLNVGRSRHG